MKKILACAALALGATSCLGPNHLFNKVQNWNADATGYDWADELVYLGLNIVPVYGLAFVADQLVLNTIDYWSGENPVADPGPFPGESFTNK